MSGSFKSPNTATFHEIFFLEKWKVIAVSNAASPALTEKLPCKAESILISSTSRNTWRNGPILTLLESVPRSDHRSECPQEQKDRKQNWRNLGMSHLQHQFLAGPFSCTYPCCSWCAGATWTICDCRWKQSPTLPVLGVEHSSLGQVTMTNASWVAKQKRQKKGKHLHTNDAGSLLPSSTG